MTGEDLSPEQIERLSELKEANGGSLTPQIILSDATEGGPLQSLFEWNDTVAAREYRALQAIGVLRVSVRVLKQPKTSAARVRIARIEEPLPTVQPRSRVPVQDLPKGLLLDAHTEIREFRRRYKRLEDDPIFGPVLQAIDQAEEALEEQNYGKPPPREWRRARQD